MCKSRKYTYVRDIAVSTASARCHLSSGGLPVRNQMPSRQELVDEATYAMEETQSALLTQLTCILLNIIRKHQTPEQASEDLASSQDSDEASLQLVGRVLDEEFQTLREAIQDLMFLLGSPEPSTPQSRRGPDDSPTDEDSFSAPPDTAVLPCLRDRSRSPRRG